MSITRYSLNDPKTVLVKVRSRKTVTRNGRIYHYGELFRVTPRDAAGLIESGSVERA